MMRPRAAGFVVSKLSIPRARGRTGPEDDLTACTLTVARVQVIVAGKVLEREAAKTPVGEQTLPLDEDTVTALRKLQRKDRMAAGEVYRPASHGGYVGADEIGAGYSTQRPHGAFYRLVESAGLRRITFYHARHPC
jgi:hypothetical protein